MLMVGTDDGHGLQICAIGIGSCRSLSGYTQGYFLEHIKKEYSTEQFKKSLNAFMNLIKKFEGEKVSSKKSMRTIYDKYIEIV